MNLITTKFNLILIVCAIGMLLSGCTYNPLLKSNLDPKNHNTGCQVKKENDKDTCIRGPAYSLAKAVFEIKIDQQFLKAPIEKKGKNKKISRSTETQQTTIDPNGNSDSTTIEKEVVTVNTNLLANGNVVETITHTETEFRDSPSKQSDDCNFTGGRLQTTNSPIARQWKTTCSKDQTSYAIQKLELIPSNLAGVTIEKTIVGDDDLRISLAPSNSSEDHISIDIDPETGLLKSVTVSSDDKTGEILNSVATLAGKIGSIFVSPGPPDSIQSNTAFQNVSLKLSPTIDSTDEKCISNQGEVINSSNEALMCFTARLTPIGQSPSPHSCRTTPGAIKPGESVNSIQIQKLEARISSFEARADNTNPGNKSDCDGICYRPISAYSLEITQAKQNGNCTLLEKQLVTMPDEKAELVDLATFRARFVKTEHTFKFSQGQLESYQINKPSQALVAWNVPINVIDAFFTGVKDVFPLRLHIVQEQTNLATQEKALLDQLVSRFNAQQAFNNRRDLPPIGAQDPTTSQDMLDASGGVDGGTTDAP